MKRPTCRPRVEELESRDTPSATAALIPTLPALLAISGHVTHPPATGMLSGNYTAPIPIPDVGKAYTLTGKGVVAGLGNVSVSASLYALGFIPSGRAGGTLTLSNQHGTLTFALTGPVQPGFSALPARFTSAVTGGTGRYKNVRGTGTATLQLQPFLYAGIACFPQPMGCSFPDAGHFRLRLT